MVLLLIKYLKPLDEVERFLPEHRAFLDRLQREGKLLLSGRREPLTGGVILADVDSELEAMKIVVDDPFFTEKVADYEVIRFTPTRSHPNLAALLEGVAA
jgi:uncharacterized protein YciI